jgi:hypothetical protein
MRRFLVGFVVAAVAAVTPTLAMAGNQEVAQQIGQQFRDSGQMSDYKIGIKYQDGKVWLSGNVASQEQLRTACELVKQTPNVRIDNIFWNEVRIVSTVTAANKQVNPLRGQDQNESIRDQNVMQTSGTQPQQSMSFGERIGSLFHRTPEVKQASATQPVDAQIALEPVSGEEPRELPRQLNVSPRPATYAGQATRAPARVAMAQPTQVQPQTVNGAPLPMSAAARQTNVTPARYDQPCMPNYAWPSYAAHPNYAAVTYPKQYSAQAWPYIGPFYPYPQVPMGWRKVTLEWDSGWWYLDFKDSPASCWHR